jgi:Right handed beta helix region
MAPRPDASVRPPRRTVVIGTLVAVAVAVLAVLAVTLLSRSGGNAPPPAAPSASQLYVSPSGRDGNDGSSAAPLATIQAALEKAGPGTVVNLGPGVYREQPTTARDGAPGAPITIKGPETGTDRSGRYRAVLYGTGRIFNIDHSHIRLEGFTIDGQERLAQTPYPTDLTTIDAFKKTVQDRVQDSKLIYVGSADESRDLSSITIDNMFLNGAGGECVRLRNNAHDNTVTNSVIQYCGMYGKTGDADRAEFHNGEGVYIGTSPKSDDQPMHDNDSSSNNVVSRNIIRTFGSECFNIKENAHDNVFEDNVCSGNAESSSFDGSNVELRGYLNVVRNNQISDSAGYTIKIANDGKKYDRGGNVVENNRLSNAAAEIFKIESKSTQGRMCGNVVAGPIVVDGQVPGGITSPC